MNRSWKLWGTVGLLLALSLSYGPSLLFKSFVYDGGRLMHRQPVIQGSWAPLKILKTDYWGRTRKRSIGSYRPFAVANLWLEHKLFGPNPVLFALTQILWMLGVCLGVVMLAGMLGLPQVVAWLAGLLFAVHPVHTAIVASIAGRADLLMALFFLLALRLHRSEHPLAGPLNITVVFLGLCSKELFVIFPAAVLLMDLFHPNQTEPQTLLDRVKGMPWLKHFQYATITGLFLWMRHHMIGIMTKFPHGAHDNPLVDASWGIKLLNAPMLFWRYVELLVLPLRLSPDRTFNAVPVLSSPNDWRFWAGALLLVALGRFFWKSNSKVRLLIALCLLAYLPISNTLVNGPIIMADRWLFLVTIPFCIGAAMAMHWLYQSFSNRHIVLFSIAGALLLFWSGVTMHYTHQWRSSLSLFAYASHSTPNSVKARFIYATELLRAGKPKLAKQQFRAAIQIKPTFSEAYLGVASAYEMMGNLKDAEQIIRDEVRRQKTRSPNARIRLVLFLRRHKRIKEAIQVNDTIRRDFPIWLKRMEKQYTRRRNKNLLQRPKAPPHKHSHDHKGHTHD